LMFKMNKLSVAVIGSRGYVGNEICKALEDQGIVNLTRVDRCNYEQAKQQTDYDTVVNAAMPSKRYWAQKNPKIDFQETVEKTFLIVNEWRANKYVQISSISARTQLNTVYGRHKSAAEKLLNAEKDLILRLGPMYGSGLSKGVLIDLLENKKVFVDKQSRYCFAPVSWVGSWIAKNLNLSGIIDIGAKNNISVEEIANQIGSKSIFSGPIDDQIVGQVLKDSPNANEVIKYMLELKKCLSNAH